MANHTAVAPAAPLSKSPYQLNDSQTLKACEVVLKNANKDDAQTGVPVKPNLLEDEDGPQESIPLWLILSTKKHVVDKRRLLPSKIAIPHSFNTSSTSSICLITADPQRTYKDLVASEQFPSELRSRISKVIGLSKLKARYKPYENRRQLFAEYDLFLADDRIVTYLPQILGKSFYKTGTKRPIPINLQGLPKKDAQGKNVKRPRDSLGQLKRTEGSEMRNPLTADSLAKQVRGALNSAVVNMAPSTTTAVKVAHAGMSAAQCSENITAVVDGLTTKFVTKGWRNVRAIHVKGANTPAFPIWLASELWVDDGDVLEEKRTYGKKKKAGPVTDVTEVEVEDSTSPGGKKRKVGETDKTVSEARHAKKKRKEELLAAESAQRKERVKKQKAQVRADVEAESA